MVSAKRFISLPGIPALIVAAPIIAISVLGAQYGFALTDHVPNFDVKGSCKAAETYDVSEDREKTFKGCMQDEDRARGMINKNWGTFKAKDRVDCVTQGEKVAPSYVEILTCLEMSDDTGALLSKDVNQPTGKAPVIKPLNMKPIEATPGDTSPPK